MSSIYTKYIFDLPIMPQVVSEVLKIPTDTNISSKEVEEILKVDPYLTARLLKIANSSFYSRVREIASVKDAVTLIGLNKVKALCLLIAGSEIINNKKEDFYQDFWSESLFTAFIAKNIALETGLEKVSDDIFTGGILHNIGEGILFNFSNEKYKTVLTKMDSFEERNALEKSEFGVDSRTVAAEVLNSWEFPKLLIDIVLNYLNREYCGTFQTITDIISISKLIYRSIIDKNAEIINSDLFLTYQSRLNLRKEKIENYIKNYFSEIESNPYYKMCYNALHS